MKKKVLLLLRERGDFVSGQEICRLFGVSRTAVWKGVESLRDEGYTIEAVAHGGYRLMASPVRLTVEEISAYRRSKRAGNILEVHEKIAYSTNLRAKELAGQKYPQGTLVVADVQQGGKGRRGRSWEEPDPGSAIAMSLLLRPEFSPTKASMITLLTALAVRDGIEKTTGVIPQIKWPNDLLINHRKICGILTELSLEEDYIQSLVVGIGINVNNPPFSGELEQKATSLREETGETVCRSRLVAEILLAFEQYYEQFLQDQDLCGFIKTYNESLISRGKTVRVLSPMQDWEGISLGINTQGALLVEREEGKVEEIFAGEVSIRGRDGYL